MIEDVGPPGPHLVNPGVDVMTGEGLRDIQTKVGAELANARCKPYDIWDRLV